MSPKRKNDSTPRPPPAPRLRLALDPAAPKIVRLLPPDVAAVLCSFLSTRDLVHFLLRTSRRLHDDDAWGRSAGGIWSSACRREWRGRSHVPEEYLAMLRFRPSAVGPEPTREAAKVQVPLNVPRNIPLAALKHSIQDSTREEITKDELCSFAWRFRFRIAAGSEWTSADPFWTNNAPMTFRFCRDGRVLEMQNNRSAVPRFPHFDEPVEMRWRFVEQPRGFPPRRKGGYVRVSVAGSEVPTYEVKRCSSKNWAFVMTSCWGAFSSADFRDVRMEEEEEEEWGAHVKREVEMYNRGIIILPEGNPEG